MKNFKHFMFGYKYSLWETFGMCLLVACIPSDLNAKHVLILIALLIVLGLVQIMCEEDER